MTDVWRVPTTWAALRAGGERRLVADEATRARIAKSLELEGLENFEADLSFDAWLDGALLRGTLRAIATRRCGVSLELFPEFIEEPIRIALLPEGSPNAPATGSEVEIDVEAEDPPEVVTGDSVDLAGYVVEALSLALDPFPRKPGAVFEPPPADEPESPFAVLRALRDRE